MTPAELLGAINLAALEQSFNEIIRCHEILRTTFLAVDGQSAQVIARALTLTLPVTDLRKFAQSERETEMWSTTS